MKPISLFAFILILFFYSCEQDNNSIDLSGEWQFQIDPEDIGVSEKWFENDLQETINLPGSMVENGKGFNINLQTQWTGGVKNTEWYNDPNYAPYHDPDNIRFPYWLQPDKKYTGAAWYSKTVIIPKNWDRKNVWLNLERPHWETRVWVNGKNTGMQNSLATPHKHDITPWLKEGENRITVCVDNRTKKVDVGQDSHSISDHTQSNWNGIVGDISLQSAGKIYIENIQVFPDIETKTIDIEATIINSGERENIEIELEAKLKNSEIETPEKSFGFTVIKGENILKMSYNLGDDALLWDEFNPNVYELSVDLEYKNGEDEKQIDFGLREFKADGSVFTINGKHLFLRGTLDCAIFPETGYPPTKIEGWQKEFRAIQE
ncbi:MAG: beta-glucuronidase, partial [Draconibacterium sp.]|nr:beta-glucuronidase [Draconibacterium sp.]